MWNWAKLIKTARAALILCVLAKFAGCQNAANAAQEPSRPGVATRFGSLEGVSRDGGEVLEALETLERSK